MLPEFEARAASIAFEILSWTRGEGWERDDPTRASNVGHRILPGRISSVNVGSEQTPKKSTLTRSFYVNRRGGGLSTDERTWIM